MKIKFKNDVVICDLVVNGVNEGKVVCNWDQLAMLMDDDLRDQVHNEFRGESNEEFLAAYLERDPDFMDVIKQNALSIGKEVNSFSELIKEARIKKGLTQREVAEALGIALRHYQQFEYTDRIPSGELMIKLVRFFDFDLDAVNEILKNQ